ncbi:helix-turn-helix domain-containing protein [Plantactinospora sp. KLBMP9567]|uniref:helix-turn-helix domain-containing protein n=1 Tax=Plantactinospora sp. KLBMP9567 TaxID=3085900 RepID=UPI002982AED7|nr:helix-turn-helix domain-containing protein [Plantactinospora sp. KLBMP9567]MDW5325003.1 helix-turn-helix domain-containing protein [Plantactinospora sp. KLBMP9567]
MFDDTGLLRPQEEQAYRLLLRLSAARPADLARLAAVPFHEASAALEGLRNKGLAMARPGPDPVFEPLPPDVALGNTLLRRQESLENARQAVAALTEEYRTSARRRNADHLVEVVVGAGALRDRLRDLQDSAREEILWFCRANPLAMSGSENAEESGALARGVRYRAIYERALLEAPGELESIAESVRAGEEARTLPTLPVRIAIADRSTAICPLVPDDERDVGEPTAALIRRSELLDALLALFESHWDRATPIRWDGDRGGLADGAPDDALDDGERFLLSLFVAGSPDKSIASQLGVSRRTVQRRLERLMALAGVDTRTGLAFQAARRGWL